MKSMSRGQVLGPWKVPKTVLNVNKDSPPLQKVMLDEAAAGKLAQKVRLSMLKIKAQNMAEDGMNVAYDAISTSDDFAAYKALCGELCAVDPGALAKEERKAFFINVYNALTVHAIIEGLCKPAYFSDTLGRLRLYASAAYNIGGLPYSLNDIENGVLRGNRKSAAPFTSLPFGPDDPRLALCLDCDPRIHFALNCGAKGCPPIAFYHADKLDGELDRAREAFFVSGGVNVQGQDLHLSMIFKWYMADFPGGVLDYIRNTAPQRVKDTLPPCPALVYTPYDWAINKK